MSYPTDVRCPNGCSPRYHRLVVITNERTDESWFSCPGCGAGWFDHELPAAA